MTEVLVPEVPPYHDKYCLDIIDYCHKLMLGPEQWCAKMRITLGEFQEWQEEHPQFKRACEVAFLVYKSRMIKKGMDAMYAKKDFNNTPWVQLMQNEFGWSQKQDIKQEAKVAMQTIEELIEADEAKMLGHAVADIIEMPTKPKKKK